MNNGPCMCCKSHPKQVNSAGAEFKRAIINIIKASPFQHIIDLVLEDSSLSVQG